MGEGVGAQTLGVSPVVLHACANGTGRGHPRLADDRERACKTDDRVWHAERGSLLAEPLRDTNLRTHPSAAAEFVVWRPCNGWSFWRYEAEPGTWVALAALRRPSAERSCR